MIKSIIKRIYRRLVGRTSKKGQTTAQVLNSQNLLFEKDVFFNNTYDEGIRVTHTPLDNPSVYFSKRRIRFYNTTQFFLQTKNLDGYVIECGCYKGLSSFIFLNFSKRLDSQYLGDKYIIIDSFEGLSAPSNQDSLGKDENGNDRYFVGAGYFATPLDDVKLALADFPKIEFIKGWIPERLAALPERKYKFVHVDLDFYDPIKGALEYFFPRMVIGGLIVIDDYGSLFWPGAKRAVEEFCDTHKIDLLNISTAQAILRK